MTRVSGLWLIAILIVATGLRLYRIDQDLPLLFEEATPMRVAEKMWSGGGDLDLNPHFFNYPSLVLYANLGAQAIVLGAGRVSGRYEDVASALAAWDADPTPIALAGRLVSVAAGVLSVWGIYLLGRAAFGAHVGLASAAVVALSPWHLGVSRVMLVDVPLLAFVALALVAAVRLCRAPDSRVALRAGLFVGLAASSKYPGALTAIAVVTGFALGARAAGLSASRALAASPLWLAGAVAVVVFAATSPYVLLDASTFAEHLGLERTHMREGHFGLDPGGAIRAYPMAIWNLLGGWGAPFLLVGLVAAVREVRRRSAHVPLLAHAALFIAVLTTWSMYGAHYLAPVVPALAVFTGLGLVRSGAWLVRRSTPGGARLATVALALLAIGVATSALARYTRPNTRELAREWLVEHARPGDAIAHEHRTVDVADDPALGARVHSVRIPMTTFEPERAAPFYDPAWYRGFDYVVVSDDVASRYRREPARFATQVAFYEALEAEWELSATFPANGYRGSRVDIYARDRNVAESDAPLSAAMVERVSAAGERVAGPFLGALGDAYLSRSWLVRAADAYRGATDLQPDSEPALYNLGTVLMALGRFEEAKPALTRAQLLNPRRVETHNNLAIARLETGDREGAAAAFRRALAVDASHENARRNLERLLGSGEGSPAEPSDVAFWLTLLHNNDGESKLLDAGRGEETVGGISRFVSVIDRLRTEFRERSRDASVARGLVVLSSGDNYLAGPELSAGLRRDPPTYDAIGLHHVGYDALAIGNHELDFGPDVFADFIDGFRRLEGEGAPPFVSANLGFDRHPRLRAARASGHIVPSLVVETDGRRVGVVGATTPMLTYISCPTDIAVGADVRGSVQAEVDALSARGIDVIVLISHLQDVDRDVALVKELRDVDIVVAGGGDEILANPWNPLVPGDEMELAGAYPMLVVDASGDTVRVVTTSGQYRYVGRLVAGFDSRGHIVKTDASATGPVRVVAEGHFPDGVRPAARVEPLVDVPLRAALESMKTSVVGRSEVALDGRRTRVRTRPTNLGRLLADAVLWAARESAIERGLQRPQIAVHNAGGIRNDTLIPPGELTELDTFRVVPFANFVTIVSGVTATRLLALLENAVSELPDASGRYAQTAGFSFAVDAARETGRVRSVVLDDGTVLVEDGVAKDVRVVLATTDFLCRGGDEYPLADAEMVSTGKSVQDALSTYVRGALGGVIDGARYPFDTADRPK